MSQVTINSLLFSLVGLLFVGLSIPLIKGRIAPNYFYGFRTAKSLSNPTIWYEINRLSGGDLLIAGSLITASSLAMAVFGQSLSEHQVATTLLIIMVVSLVGVAVHGLILLRRM
jgi:uncharacterized membrane protein